MSISEDQNISKKQLIDMVTLVTMYNGLGDNTGKFSKELDWKITQIASSKSSQKIVS